MENIWKTSMDEYQIIDEDGMNGLEEANFDEDI